ncbi:hypothetical protein GCM10027026_17600 [Myroides odoratimimus subsp. xuanwuensis]
MPLHEGAEQIDLVRGVDFGAQLGSEVRLATAVGEECRVRQRRLRSSGLDIEHSGPGVPGKASQLLRWGVDSGTRDFKKDDEAVEKLKPTVRISSAFQGTASELIDVPSQHVRLVSRVHLGELGAKRDLVVERDLQRLGHQLLVESGKGQRLFRHWPKLSWSPAIWAEARPERTEPQAILRRLDKLDSRAEWSIGDSNS